MVEDTQKRYADDITLQELVRLRVENERLREALNEFVLYGCPACHGDCGSANPPVSGCPITMACSALQQKDSE